MEGMVPYSKPTRPMRYHRLHFKGVAYSKNEEWPRSQDLP